MPEKKPNASEIPEGIIKALANNQIDTASAKKALELSDQIRNSIDSAGEFLSAREKEAFRKRMEALKGTEQGDLTYLHAEIKRTIEQSQALVSQLNTNLEGSGLSDEIKKTEQKFFLSLPLAEKKAYLLKRVEDLRSLAGMLDGESPDATDLRQRLDELENSKLSPAEILARRDQNERDYRSKLEKHASYFRKASRDKYIASFSLLSLKKQAEWIESFEKTELPERKELQEKFDQFSAKHRQIYPNFRDLSREQKKGAIAKLENLLVAEARAIVINPGLRRHLSPETAKGYLLYIEGKGLDGGDLQLSIKERENSLRVLASTIEKEAELTFHFEEFPPHLQLQHRHFFMLDYLSKEKLLQEMKELDSERLAREATYEGELEKAHKENLISQITLDAYMAAFKKLQKPEKEIHYIAQLKNQMAPRRELLTKWMALSAEVRDPRQKEFDLASGSERQELYDEINPEKAENPETVDEKPEILQLRMQAEKFEAALDFSRALLLYESLLELKPDDQLSLARVKLLKSHLETSDHQTAEKAPEEDLPQISAQKADQILQSILGGEMIKTERRHLAIQQAAIHLQAKSERLNGGSAHISARDNHLDGIDKLLNAELIDQYGMTIQDSMATDLHVFDMGKLNQSGVVRNEHSEAKWLHRELGKPGAAGHDVQLVNSQGLALDSTLAGLAWEEHRTRLGHEILSQALRLAQTELDQPLNEATIQLFSQALSNLPLEAELQA